MVVERYFRRLCARREAASTVLAVRAASRRWRSNRHQTNPFAGMGSLDHHPVTDIHSNVVRRLAIEKQVAGLELIH